MIGTSFHQEALQKLSELGDVYIVGGAIRDFQVGLPAKDVDAVIGMPLAIVEENLRSFGYTPHRIGAKTETVSVFQNGERLDLTELPGSILNDALRRDFTVNALYWNVRDGALEDPLSGAGDLQAKILRACGNPEERFSEDPVRILRMVRLAVRYGLEIELLTLEAAKKTVALLSETAVERVTAEICKIIVLEDTDRALRLLDEIGYWEAFVPELARLKGLVQNRYHAKDAWEHTLHVVSNTPSELLLRLAALFHDIGKWETASRECYVWGRLKAYKHGFFVESFEIVGKDLDRLSDKNVQVHGARLDNYPNTIQVKHIALSRVKRNGFEWVTDGKRHFLQHERESARLLKEKLLPRFKFAMFLSTPGRKAEQELVFLVEHHMVGTLAFMTELRGEAAREPLTAKARKFAWKYGSDGKGFYPERVFNLLKLWRADYFGGKQRAEGDAEKFEMVQTEIFQAVEFLNQRSLSLDWKEFELFASGKGLDGVMFGRFKEQIRRLVIIEESLSLRDNSFLEREYHRFVNDSG